MSEEMTSGCDDASNIRPVNEPGNRNPVDRDPVNSVQSNVVALNDAAQVFDALADGIYGSAVGWPDGAIEKLAVALVERYQPVIGEAAVARLITLAQCQPAA